MSTLQSQVLELTKQLKELTVMVCSKLELQAEIKDNVDALTNESKQKKKVQGG